MIFSLKEWVWIMTLQYANEDLIHWHLWSVHPILFHISTIYNITIKLETNRSIFFCSSSYMTQRTLIQLTWTTNSQLGSWSRSKSAYSFFRSQKRVCFKSWHFEESFALQSCKSFSWHIEPRLAEAKISDTIELILAVSASLYNNDEGERMLKDGKPRWKAKA